MPPWRQTHRPHLNNSSPTCPHCDQRTNPIIITSGSLEKREKVYKHFIPFHLGSPLHNKNQPKAPSFLPLLPLNKREKAKWVLEIGFWEFGFVHWFFICCPVALICVKEVGLQGKKKMSAKLLMGLSEENPELERQIGCMTGIFQVFDRHHLIAGRRLIGQSHKRLPSGQSRPISSVNADQERIPGSPRIVLEYNSKKGSKESRRVSAEPSPSVFSSPSLPFPSLDVDKKASKPKIADGDARVHYGHFRDVVKDSINAETRVLSVKTSVKEKHDNVFRYKDSPRPVTSVDLNDSLRVLVRLKDSSWNVSEVPRFSCDGREMMTRSKSSTKLRELPRLSLDSKEMDRPKATDRSSLGQGIPSVVAKLMGLEAMPSPACQEPTEFLKRSVSKRGEEEEDRAVQALKSCDIAPEIWKPKHAAKKPESVYSQIERRVKEIEFPESNKDLRALKHILDTMQAKGILQNKQSDDQQQPRIVSENNLQGFKQSDCQNPNNNKPIVIMKPAKPRKHSGELEGLSGLRKLKTGDRSSTKKAKEQEGRSRSPAMQRSPRPQMPTRERSRSPSNTVSSSSPRVQQRKVDQEKKPPVSARKQKADRKQLEPVRTKTSQGHQGKPAEVISRRHDLAIRLANQMDSEVLRDDHIMKINTPSYELDNQKIQNEDSSSTDSTTVSAEQPSPISVLEAAFYQDYSPPSPVMKISCKVEDGETRASPEEYKPGTSLVDTTPAKLTSEIHLQKLRGIEALVERLNQLSSTSQEQAHDFVSRLLLSAGLVPEGLKYDRLHENLMFVDAVEELLARKLESLSHGPQATLFHRAKKLSGHRLWTELCSEIEQLVVKKPRSSTLEEEEEHELKIREDLVRLSDGWDDFGTELPGMFLEIERSIFKDLIDEIVTGEAHSGPRSKPSRRRRQLFT